MSFTRFNICILASLLLCCMLATTTALAQSQEQPNTAEAEKTYAQLLKTDPAFASYDKELNETWQQFYQSFDPQYKKILLGWYKNSLGTYMANFPAPAENPEAFSRYMQSCPLAYYMRTVVHLAKAPDARLQFLISYLPESAESTSPGMPEFSILSFAGDTVRIYPTYPAPLPEAFIEQKDYTARWQNTPGQSSTLSIDWKLLPGDQFNETYTIYRTASGAFYGFTRSTVAGRHESGTSSSNFIRVENGQISMLTMHKEPSQSDFFQHPDKFSPWHYPTDKPSPDQISLRPCTMHVNYTLQDDSSLVATLEQTNHNAYDAAWLCIPQCSITYRLDNSSFVQKEKICLPAKAHWGVFAPNI